MTIKRNNFEAYLLDYLEGNLDPLLTADLMAFLAENPEFEKYIPDFEIQPLKAQSGNFENKQLLKKDFADIHVITPENFDEFCIASCEGLLSDNDVRRLEAYVAQHTEKQKDLELFRVLKLQPDLSLQFHDKLLLKRPAGRSYGIRYLYFGFSIAASVALLILLAMNRKSADNPEITSSLANRNPQNKEVPVSAVDSLINGSVAPAKQNTVADRKVTLVPHDNTPSAEATEHPRDIIHLALLEPIAPELKTAESDPERALAGIDRITRMKPGMTAKKAKPEWMDSGSLLGTLISKVDFWKTAETAIDGFNYLTEAQLSVTRRMDENGNTNGVVVNTESYSIATK